MSPVGPKNKTYKNKLTEEKHTNLFRISFMYRGAFIRKWRPKEMVKPAAFKLGWTTETFMEKYTMRRG